MLNNTLFNILINFLIIPELNFHSYGCLKQAWQFWYRVKSKNSDSVLPRKNQGSQDAGSIKLAKNNKSRERIIVVGDCELYLVIKAQ